MRTGGYVRMLAGGKRVDLGARVSFLDWQLPLSPLPDLSSSWPALASRVSPLAACGMTPKRTGRGQWPRTARRRCCMPSIDAGVNACPTPRVADLPLATGL